MIQKRSDMQGIDISKYKISNIYNWKRKNRQLLLLHGMKTPKKMFEKGMCCSKSL